MSWTPIEDIERRSEELAMIDKVLNKQLPILDTVSHMPPRKITEIQKESKENSE